MKTFGFTVIFEFNPFKIFFSYPVGFF